MKSKIKLNFFRNIVSNFIIILLIFSVFITTQDKALINYASTNNYSAIYQGNTNNNNISLMINVYWGTEYVEPMLNILENNNVVTTFFVGGTWANANCNLLKQMVNKGHEIGNHGYYHKDHSKINRQRNFEEISITHKLVNSLTGIEMNLFAPPSGAYNATTLEVAKELGYKTIMWSKDTIDWRDKNSNLILNRACNNLQNGDLILMHPTKHTLQVFDNIIKTIKNQGFNLTTVSQTIAS